MDKMSHLENALAEHHFVRIHRCFLVNLAYVFIRNVESVRLTHGEELPVGRSYADNFKPLYERFRKENG
jgi:DNA-binding LytR/AlgR family response regulator